MQLFIILPTGAAHSAALLGETLSVGERTAMEYEMLTEEQDYRRRSYNWKTAIGLQKVDNLVPNRYLLELANRNISGEISLSEVREKLRDYYENKPPDEVTPERQKEADYVSQRISAAL
ncbi:MAG: antitoxin VbhA family protein [Chitinispirillales bacterium]|nr:antitoxin VbhA family protein [Chitinispirillales bacterium]